MAPAFTNGAPSAVRMFLFDLLSLTKCHPLLFIASTISLQRYHESKSTTVLFEAPLLAGIVNDSIISLASSILVLNSLFSSSQTFAFTYCLRSTGTT